MSVSRKPDPGAHVAQLLSATVHVSEKSRKRRLGDPHGGQVVVLLILTREVRFTSGRIGADSGERMDNEVTLSPRLVEPGEKVAHFRRTCRVGLEVVLGDGLQPDEPFVEAAAHLTPRRACPVLHRLAQGVIEPAPQEFQASDALLQVEE